jgi:glutamate-1-semialdehyde aminotransferase
MSTAWDLRARGSISHGALTNSKRPESFVKGVYPSHLLSGNGPFLTDVSGKKYFDFICGLGSCLLGYNHNSLVEAGIKAETMGCTLSLSSTYEVMLAEKIREYFPSIERVRFLKTGSEACTAAVTIARSYTKRMTVLSDAYHGWNPEFISLTPPANGCPPSPYIKPLTGNKIDDSIAAVIIEPVITDWSDARKRQLEEIREQCTRYGVKLIFDETITALRFPSLSVATYFGISPDLMVFGKALGGGGALACVGGKAEIMECDYFVSSTFAGEIGPIMKALKVLDIVKNQIPVLRLWEFGVNFWHSFNSIMDGIVHYEGYPTRGVLKGEEMPKALFMQEACKAGLLFGASPFLMYPHMQYREEIYSVLRDVAMKIKIGKVKLEGDLPMKPYAQTIRDKK